MKDLKACNSFNVRSLSKIVSLAMFYLHLHEHAHARAYSQTSHRKSERKRELVWWRCCCTDNRQTLLHHSLSWCRVGPARRSEVICLDNTFGFRKQHLWSGSRPETGGVHHRYFYCPSVLLPSPPPATTQLLPSGNGRRLCWCSRARCVRACLAVRQTLQGSSDSNMKCVRWSTYVGGEFSLFLSFFFFLVSFFKVIYSHLTAPQSNVQKENDQFFF